MSNLICFFFLWQTYTLSLMRLLVLVVVSVVSVDSVDSVGCVGCVDSGESVESVGRGDRWLEFNGASVIMVQATHKWIRFEQGHPRKTRIRISARFQSFGLSLARNNKSGISKKCIRGKLSRLQELVSILIEFNEEANVKHFYRD